MLYPPKCDKNCRIAAAGNAPDFRANSRPSRINTNVGIARIPNCCATSGNVSVFTFAIKNCPFDVSATFANSGATILHGPHHGAQKSTSTGKGDLSVRPTKARLELTSIGTLGISNSV